MFNIAVDQYLSNSDLHKHICLENIKTLYKTSGKCDDQHQYKAIIEAAMVSTPKECTDNSPMTPNQYKHTKNPSERKPLHKCLEALDVRHNTAVCILGTSSAKELFLLHTIK